MIQYREWMVAKPLNVRAWDRADYKMSGWFLFGIIPLYVRRIGL
jgi:hypothetical protein